jgi:hypothetical protein
MSEQSRRAPSTTMDSTAIYKLFQETETLLAYFEKRAAKRKSLDEGNEVCRYLVWSRILVMLKENAAQSVIAIDVTKLEKRVSKLQDSIRERFKQWKPEKNSSADAPIADN